MTLNETDNLPIVLSKLNYFLGEAYRNMLVHATATSKANPDTALAAKRLIQSNFLQYLAHGPKACIDMDSSVEIGNLLKSYLENYNLGSSQVVVATLTFILELTETYSEPTSDDLKNYYTWKHAVFG